MDNSPISFLQYLMDAIGQRSFAPTPTNVPTGGGLRPQDDTSMRLIMNALRGDPTRGIGPNQPGRNMGLDVSLQRILQGAIRAPGTTEVNTRPQTQTPGMMNNLEAGTMGTTSPRTGEVNIYPEQHSRPGDIYNTLAHELVHAMRVNRGVAEPNNNRGGGVEEGLAYYGTGSPVNAWMDQLPNDLSAQGPAQNMQRQDQLLAQLLQGAPATQPSRGLPQVGSDNYY